MPGNSSKTQQQRRTETRQALLAGARYCFAKNGYQQTSLEDIAGHCKLTTRPVYHYFGSKQALFSAVADELEQELARDMLALDAKQPGYLQAIWQVFMDKCKNRDFRRIVLLEAPVILGRERWQNNEVVQIATDILKKRLNYLPEIQARLINRMTLVALAEAALMIAEADDSEAYIEAANQLAKKALKKL